MNMLLTDRGWMPARVSCREVPSPQSTSRVSWGSLKAIEDTFRDRVGAPAAYRYVDASIQASSEHVGNPAQPFAFQVPWITKALL